MQLNINSLQIQSSGVGGAAGTSQTDAVSSVRDPAVSGSSVSLHSAESSPTTSTPKSADVSGADTHSAERNTSDQKASDQAGSDQRTATAVKADLTALENEQIQQLATRDREVRQHEQAHASAGGAHAGAPSYEYRKGPDGRLYAVSGEVSIDTSAVPNDPQATLEKAEIVLRAALAVSEPSGADRAVAARATALAEQARAELSTQDASGAESAGEESVTADGLSGETDAGRADALKEELSDNQAASEREEDEQDAARQDAQRESQAADAVRRQDALDELNTDREEHSAAVSQSLEDYNQRLDEVGERFAEVNQRLVEAGVFKKFFPEGLIIDQSV
ncbi:putative metalloprotease CJM1_0395 family protein [Aliamphritea hakodatensis]|uniref:putative metalloprotease CJM1_0395 family protein n=1 Tax=Aliamphritea hakodatensis TaxID=2895352 RepID=UPI0022FD4A91|nr:putative metalloprotease CJM1_0395 family protein [Aliamphritea hakodatensis]